MLRLLSGCAGRLLGLVLLLAALAVAWYNRDELAELADALLDRDPVVSAELADEAAAKLGSLGRDGVTRIAFHQPELQSLVDYRWADYLPPDLTSPRVGLDAGRVTLEGDVATARFRGFDELREVLGFLPDTASIRVVASLVPLDSAHAALEVHELAAVGIPLPARFIPAVVERLRAEGTPAVGPNAVAVPLPPAIGNVWVSGDSLVVSARGGT